MILEEFEPVSGGKYRYIHKDKDGNEYGFHGTFHEMSIDNMVQTFEFEGYPGHVSLDTMTLEELPGVGQKPQFIPSFNLFLTEMA